MKRNPRQAKKAKRIVRLLRIASTDLGPDDTLVVRTDARVQPEDVSRIRESLGCKVLVLPPDAKLDIVRAAP